jgi:BASS family bile acid:Na+ symporter
MILFTVSLTLALLFAALAVCTWFVKMLHGMAFTFSVLAVGSAAVAYPPLFIAWGGFELKQAITPLVQLILLGMGMTLTVGDFRRVVTMPRAIVLGFVLQFTVMPLGGLLFAWLFGLTGAVATGLILIVQEKTR